MGLWRKGDPLFPQSRPPLTSCLETLVSTPQPPLVTFFSQPRTTNHTQDPEQTGTLLGGLCQCGLRLCPQHPAPVTNWRAGWAGPRVAGLGPGSHGSDRACLGI